MKRGIIIGIVVVLLFVAGFVLDTLYVSGAFKKIEPHFAGTCKSIGGVVGTESITIAPDGRHALASADDRRSALAGHPVPGAIWAYDLSGETPLTNLTPDATDEFHPHGIGLWVSPSGEGRLFVINHRDEGRKPPGEGRQTIEIYDWKPDAITHLQTLSDPLVITPNAVIPTGPESFYVSNDHGPNGFLRNFDDFLALPRANVIYYDGKHFQVAVSGIALANGVNLSADGKQFYLASTLGQELLTYDRDPVSGALANRRVLPLGTAPDNIERAADGTLWIGAHPQLLKLLAYAGNPASPAPAQVLKVTPGTDGGGKIEEIYLGAGQELGAASGGAVSGERLLIATVFDDHFLDCTMK
jgi:arylesterase/paraoxonase